MQSIHYILLFLLMIATASISEDVPASEENSQLPDSSLGRIDSSRIISESCKVVYKTKRNLLSQTNPKNAKRKFDHFIDRDGDGICDGRESAVGLKKMLRHRKGRSKK